MSQTQTVHQQTSHQTLGCTQLEVLCALFKENETVADIINFIKNTSLTSHHDATIRKTVASLVKAGLVEKNEGKSKGKSNSYIITDLGREMTSSRFSSLRMIYEETFLSDTNDLDNEISIEELVAEINESNPDFADNPLRFYELRDNFAKSSATCEKIVTLHKTYHVYRDTFNGIAAVMLVCTPTNWYNQALEFFKQEPKDQESLYFYFDAANGTWVQSDKAGEEKCTLELDFFTKQLLRVATVS